MCVCVWPEGGLRGGVQGERKSVENEVCNLNISRYFCSTLIWRAPYISLLIEQIFEQAVLTQVI